MNDVDGKPRTHPDASRLSTILLMNTVIVHKVVKEKVEKGDTQDSLKFMIRNCFFQQFEKNSTIRDVLLDIGHSLPSFAITRALCNLADFKFMIDNCSSSVLETLNNCYEEN